MREFLTSLCCLLVLLLPGAAGADDGAEAPGTVIVVIGASGADEYAATFHEWGQRWVNAAEQGHWQVQTLGLTDQKPATLEQLRSVLEPALADAEAATWLVLIGHGTFDGREAKFNLPGPDVSATQLAEMVANRSGRLAVINCASASSPFLPALSVSGRVVITSTQGGNEVNFSRFGDYLSSAITSTEADLDKDEQTSLLEAFLLAARRTSDFYEADGRLATEHAVLDDNGDQRPVPAGGFQGIRPINRDDPPDLLPDGLVAHQWHLVPSNRDAQLAPEVIARRNDLELAIAQLRQQKSQMAADDYDNQLEALLLEMARLLIPADDLPAADDQEAIRPE